MLNLWFGIHEKCTHNINGYFGAWFVKDNLLSDYSRRAIELIDNCKLFDKNVVIHEVYGGISPDKLSATCHSVLLAKYNPEIVVDFNNVGEKGYPMIAELVKEQDVLMCTSMYIGDLFRTTDINKACIVNLGNKIVHTSREYLMAMSEFEKKGGNLFDRGVSY